MSETPMLHSRDWTPSMDTTKLDLGLDRRQAVSIKSQSAKLAQYTPVHKWYYLTDAVFRA